MEITSDITVESKAEPLHYILLEATLTKPIYSAITSGKDTTSLNRAPQCKTIHDWKDQ
ncbi:27677_t:CDS:2 [Gigaspora margarita]|uniref:27677_t:CDS:1 n=1 Tax=Gigaspora margarita TaxID=4874 RepID=A0ABN7V1N1_GIGMA|nr:27677_t:CDS:2 [Gigaspora margarita]